MLSFTLSGKHITYTEAHALILNHNKHLTITDIRIFMNSYNTFTYIIILVTNLCLYIKSNTYGRLIFIPISRRTQIYTYLPYVVLNLYMYLYGGTYPHTYTSISLILVQISHRSYRAYTYTEVPLDTTWLILIP